MSNASRTMLFNINECRWDAELMELFGVPAAMLPDIRDSAGDFGLPLPFKASMYPLLVVAGDQQAALFWTNLF